MKTLFIRPVCDGGNNDKYPERLVGLFNDLYYKNNSGTPVIPEEQWVARISPFENAGVRVMVIGAPNCPYHPDEADIVNITCKGLKGTCPAMDGMPCNAIRNSYCEAGNMNYGHIYFGEGRWWWDTLGLTQGVDPHHYGTPEIFPFAVENLFTEGSYWKLQVGQKPVRLEKPENALLCHEKPCYDESKHCPNLSQCYDFQHCSPLAINAEDPISGRPEGTMQFNREIVFTNGEATIEDIPYEILEGKRRYNRKEILAFIIVHEIGHALLDSQSSDHCNNEKCIMCNHITEWDINLLGFGPGPEGCDHRRGGPLDIREKIHNSPD